MAGLRRSRLDEAIVARAALGRPLLAICLGLQVLCVESDESPGVAGLGVIPGRVTRLRPEAGVRVPHLGWSAGSAPAPDSRSPKWAWHTSPTPSSSTKSQRVGPGAYAFMDARSWPPSGGGRS